jgi:hypothetical protein
MNPEKYQRQKIIEHTGYPCEKTHARINLRTNRLEEISRPNIKPDGFDYSENFDGVQRIFTSLTRNMKILTPHANDKILTPPTNDNTTSDDPARDQTQTHTVYINLKCIVGRGGGQTRFLREVYWFVTGQLNLLAASSELLSSPHDNNGEPDTTNHNPIYFANILDGDEADAAMNKFSYLLGLAEYARVKHRVYVGDLKGYLVWIGELIQG